MSNRLCQVCQKQAFYVCSECKYTAYCTRQHQIEHWKTHKQSCKVLSNYNEILAEEKVQKQRFKLRKAYFENFVNKIFDQCLTNARELVALEQSNLEVTRLIANQLEYGASVTLLCKTLLILFKQSQAKIEIQQYLKLKKHFLQDLRDILPPVKNKELSSSSKEFFQKKVSLIAGIANLLYQLKEDCIEFYDIYTQHIEKFFGDNSPELSNCYFMIGCYYKESQQYNKSIACFIKAASLRTSKAGDCYLNVGILTKLQGKTQVAIQMLELAIQLKQEQNGENSSQVAQIHECLAHIHSENKNFSSAMRSLEKALQIRANNMTNEKQSTIHKEIKNLYDDIKSHLQAGTIQDISKPQFYSDLKSTVNERIFKNIRKAPGEESNEDSFKSEDKRLDIVDNLGRIPKVSGFDEKIFKLSQGFMARLNKTQLYHLSELQIELEKCKSEYAVAYTVGKSNFIRSLLNQPNRLKELKNQNEKLFEQINLQQIIVPLSKEKEK